MRAVGLANRTARLLSLSAGRRFDAALGGHTSDFVTTARALGIPSMTLLDDDWPARATTLALRLADEVAVPDALPPAALAAHGRRANTLFRYPGFKEEYYLYDFVPDPDALAKLGVAGERLVGVVRPCSPGGDAASFADEAALLRLTRELAERPNVTLVVLSTDEGQRERFLALDRASLLAPCNPEVEGASLVAAADFVLGAGGTTLREAAALGVPVYTVSRRPATPVEAALVGAKRLRYITSGREIAVCKRTARTSPRPTRDPALFVERTLSLPYRHPHPARLDRLVYDLRRRGGRGNVSGRPR